MNDKPNSFNTWTDELYESIVAAIYEVKAKIKEQAVDGVIIISGKENTFHTGANLNKAGKAQDGKVDKMRTIEFNQSVLNRIAGLSVPVLAAINGHCLGGGMELTLACTARIAKDSPKTMIGLTETSIGLLPAGGGTQRLPRLIGYPAVDLILDAKKLSAPEALKYGIVDKLVPADADLIQEAKAFMKGIISGEVKLNRTEHDFSKIDEIIKEALAKEIKKARGRLLPAPKAVLSVIGEGLKLPLSEGLELEKKEFITVALSPECKGYINTFFLKGLTGDPRKMMTRDFEPKELKKLAVLGFGTMGRGIIINALRDSDLTVLVKDTPEALETGKQFILKTLNGFYEKKTLKTPPEEVMKRLTITEKFGSEFADVDIAIEAIFENPEAKKVLYEELTKVVRKDCLIASNTSGLAVNDLAEFVENPERFGGLHFFSPVWIMQLVEVVKGEKTSQETVDNMLAFAGKINKRPLVCHDNPGFVVNAVNAPFSRNGLRYVEEGNSVEKVDAAFRAFGFAVGPIKMIDEVGMDVIHNIYKNRGEEQKTLENMYNAGRFGLKKCGKGFFLADGSVDTEAIMLVAKREAVNRAPEDIPVDFLKEQIAIAKDLLDRKIVDGPAMIDIGILFGSGFPADKGGALKWADLIGLSEQMYGKKFYE